MASAGSAGAHVFGAGLRPPVSHDLGALVVEDQQVLVCLDEIDDLAGEQPGDVEAGLADLDDAVDSDPGGSDLFPADWSHLLLRAGLSTTREY